MNKYRTHLIQIAAAAAIVAAPLCTYALDLSTYASSSVLSTGRWVKVSVPQSGIYKITASQLSQWGFKDLSKVRIYGYGGNRIGDEMTAANYIDDLPLIQSATVNDGVVFYGVGPESWTVNNKYVRKTNNIYTNNGYYFVTESDQTEARTIEAQTTALDANATPVSVYNERLHHELDLSSPGEAGYVLVGENFNNENGRKIMFETPGRVKDQAAWFECAIVAKTLTGVQVDYYVNGEKLESVDTDKISAVSSSSGAYVHGTYNITTHDVPQTGDRLEVRINVRDISSTQNVWLDYLTLTYPRRLALDKSGYLNFWSSSQTMSIEGAGSGVNVWDVTNPANITSLNTTIQGSSLCWTNQHMGNRTYAAWSADSKIPSPAYVGTLSNQDIHSMESPQMVIFAPLEFKAQAERIVKLHSELPDPITVSILTLDEVYNEFGSGMADVSALRKCLKMFYDRSINSDRPLQYALLLGRTTYDNRHLTSQFASANAYTTIPYWMGGQPSAQFSDNTAYGTDDFIAMLADGTGLNMGLDDLAVGVGRLPVTSVSELKNYIDKLYQYTQENLNGLWRNSILFLADDGDSGEHLEQTEQMVAELLNTPNQQMFINKVYVDAYDIVGGVCEGGRKDMYRMLNEGISWWNFCGHANNHSWTGEGMLTFTDINNMYLRNIPIVMAATCDFLRWDSNMISGGEIMLHERNGGAISMISATRPVYISYNKSFTSAVGRSIARRNDDGSMPRLGDLYRNAKNDITNGDGVRVSNPNRSRYVLMGDPAMPMPMPSNIVKLETIDGVEVTADNQATLKALQQATISGGVYRPDGSLIEDFDGTVLVSIYDAERSMTTKGERNDNVVIPFDTHGDKLFQGSGNVKNGRFSIKIAMPSEVADNFRPAMMNMYAYASNSTVAAAGINKDFYVYGYDETVAADTEAPVIESIVLNHPSFNNGDEVNDSPMLIAKVSDNVGINLSAAGIGHQMTVTLDGRKTLSDISQFFYPSEDGSASGEIRYPLSNLETGDHSLSLKVWDTASNSTHGEIEFKVSDGQTPTIFNVYTDVNPASTEVKFFVSHNRPDAELKVTITVYDLLGHPLWETTETGLSNMFVSAPVTWDLTDTAGRRLPRGIYLYRASISTDNGENYESAARRLAVTAY